MTQGDPLAMAMYALALVPMITYLSDIVKQVWYADDAAAAGHLIDLRTWWDNLQYVISVLNLVILSIHLRLF